MKTFIYLAGPVGGQTNEEANVWRNLFAQAMDNASDGHIVGVSPLRNEAPKDGVTYDTNYTSLDSAAITAKNMLDVARCDLTLAFLPSVSIGTLQEIGWATAAKKPIILVSDLGLVMDNAIIQATVPWRFAYDEGKGFRRALDTITDLYGVYK